MGSILEKIWFLVAVMPVLIAIEGLKKLAKIIGEKNWLWAIPYALLIILIVLLVILFSLGYR